MRHDEIRDLYVRIGPAILRRCQRLLGDSQMAQDATQEVFVRTLQAAGRLSDDRSYLPWLYRVATNHCIDRLKERARLVPSADGGWGEETTESGCLEAGTEAKELVRSLLAQLDPLSREIAVYAFLDRMTQDEIAAVIGQSRRTVGKKLRRVVALAHEVAGMNSP